MRSFLPHSAQSGVVSLEPFGWDRFAFVVVHVGLDAVRARSVALARRKWFPCDGAASRRTSVTESDAEALVHTAWYTHSQWG